MGWQKILAPFKEAFVLYYEQSLKVLLLHLLYTLPILLFVSSGSMLGMHYLEQEAANLLILFFSMFGFSLAQIPFIYMVQCKEEGNDVMLKGIFLSIKKNLSSVYVTGLFVAACVTVGYHFLIVPGVIGLVLLVLFPQASVIERAHYKNSLQRALAIGSSHFLHLMNVILFFVMIDWWLYGVAERC